jgi:hypothetical protein
VPPIIAPGAGFVNIGRSNHLVPASTIRVTSSMHDEPENTEPIDLGAMRAICDAAIEAVRLQPVPSGQILPVCDDLHGVIDIDPNSVGPFVGGQKFLRGMHAAA